MQFAELRDHCRRRIQRPTGVAVDGDGSIYVLSGGSNGIVSKIPWNASTGNYGVPAVLATGLNLQTSAPGGVAVDGTGNLFFTDTINKHVTELPWNANANAFGAPVILTSGTSLPAPSGVAVDGFGDIYIADASSQVLVEVSPGGEQTTLATGIHASSIAVDGSGNLYYSDSVANTITKLPWIGSSLGAPVILATGLSAPNGIAVDDSGDIFIANTGTHSIMKATVSVPPSLSFASTRVDATSSDSPEIATLANIGNAALSIPATAGVNPSISVGFRLDSSTTCPQVLSSSAGQSVPAGASCKFAVSFSPNSSEIGSNQGALELTDDALNAKGAMQSIGLSGTAISDDASAVTVTLNPGSPVEFGKAIAITALVKDTTSPGTTPTGSVTFSASSGGTAPPVNISSMPLSGGASASSYTPAAVGTYTITANYAGALGTIAHSNSTASLTVTQNSPSLAYTPMTTTQTYGTGIPAAALNATAVDVNGATVPGTFTYTTTVNSKSTSLSAGIAVLPVGSYTITATFMPADTNDYVSGETISASYTVTQSTASVTLGNLAQIYNGTMRSATAVTVPANLNVVFTYNGSSTPPVLAGSYTVVATVSDADYKDVATGTLVVAKALPDFVAVTSSAASVVLQNAVTFTATVSSPLGEPTGSVIFLLDGGNSIGSSPLVGSVSTLTTSLHSRSGRIPLPLSTRATPTSCRSPVPRLRRRCSTSL